MFDVLLEAPFLESLFLGIGSAVVRVLGFAREHFVACLKSSHLQPRRRLVKLALDTNAVRAECDDLAADSLDDAAFKGSS